MSILYLCFALEIIFVPGNVDQSRPWHHIEEDQAVGENKKKRLRAIFKRLNIFKRFKTFKSSFTPWRVPMPPFPAKTFLVKDLGFV